VSAADAGAPNAAADIEGPAFPALVKALAGVLMAAIMVYGLRSLDDLAAERRTWPLLLFALLLMAIAAWCYSWILKSHTRVSATHLHQTWWSDKSVAIADITQTRLILVPGLTWLIAPRLVVRTHAPGSIVFHAADPRLIAAFARLSLGLPALPDA
jgi:hypothetical protein